MPHSKDAPAKEIENDNDLIFSGLSPRSPSSIWSGSWRRMRQERTFTSTTRWCPGSCFPTARYNCMIESNPIVISWISLYMYVLTYSFLQMQSMHTKIFAQIFSSEFCALKTHFLYIDNLTDINVHYNH